MKQTIITKMGVEIPLEIITSMMIPKEFFGKDKGKQSGGERDTPRK